MDYQKLHKDVCVFLSYTNPAMRFYKNRVDAGWWAEDDKRAEGGLKNLRRGDVDIAAISVGVHVIGINKTAKESHEPEIKHKYMPVCSEAETIRMILRFLDAMVGVIDANSSDVAIARTVREAEKINAEDRMAIFLHLTGAWCAGDIAVLRTYYRLGVRAIHICVEGLSGVGDASDEYAELGGLSDFGRQLVHEMNQLGMVVDVAHASDQVVEEISKISTAPIISSHTSCRKFCNIKRALPDYLIKKIADTGGVVGLIFASSMLQQIVEKEVDHKYKEIWQAKQDALQSMYPNPYEFLSHYMTYETAQEVSDTAGVSMEVPIRVDIDALVDSIDYIVKLTSVDHVSIGPDYDIGCAPKGLEKADTLSNLTKALLRRGYSESDIHKIWGGNLKRVYRSVIGE